MHVMLNFCGMSRMRDAGHPEDPAEFVTPYGIEIVEMSTPQRIYIFDIGGPHSFRTIHVVPVRLSLK
jgi:hypothetical protein